IPAQDDDVQEHVTEEIIHEVVTPTPTSPSPSSLVIPSSPHHQSPCPPQPQAAEGSSHLFQQELDTCSALVLRVEGLENANAAQQQEIITLKARVKKLERLNKGRQADKQAEIYNIDLDHSSKVLSMQEDDTKVQEAVEVVTTAKLITEVVTTAATQIGKGILIEDLKPIKKKDQIEMDAEYAKKLHEELDKKHEEAYKQIDWNAALDHVQAKEPQYIKRYHGIKKKPQSESEAHKNMISYLKNTEGYKMEFFKGKTYDQINGERR
nr:hypothetical protein [Tanacetum cinerariifolium]